ncbi:MAG: hypothetical protein CL969_02800 [Euryarchaeota archaeon]|nr:hypothetical protein [Euryarchaeota archaeon]MDP6379181.1 hypothetical protein [Candidatus Thalassarchaeaceae archaeon]
MTTVRGSASSSGHITLLFSVQDSSIHLLEQGSRGVGLCIDTDEPTCSIVVEGVLCDDEEEPSVDNHTHLPLHQTVIEELAKYCPEITDYYWQINQYCSLPQQQGFGLSAAGALACAMALQIALGVEPSIAKPRSFQIAHIVERRLSGGLGDVSALWVGGVDLRREPGCPFLSDDYGGNGEVESWHHPMQMLVVWRNRKTRHTSSYIDNPEWKVRIRMSGEETITPLLSGDWNSYRWREILDAATIFANQSGLASDAGRAELLDIANEAIVASGTNATPLLCMLGESVVIIPNNLDSNLSINEMGKIADYLESVNLQSCIVNLSSDTLR